jgi:hypothetical protein
MLITLIMLLLTIIAAGITYVAHLQRRLLEAQDTLICHFIELVRVEMNDSVKNTNDELRELISMRK